MLFSHIRRHVLCISARNPWYWAVVNTNTSTPALMKYDFSSRGNESYKTCDLLVSENFAISQQNDMPGAELPTRFAMIGWHTESEHWFFLEYSGPRTSMDKINSGSIMLYNNERLCKNMLGWQEHAMRYAAINRKYRASPRLIVSNNISKTEYINRGFQCLYRRGKTFPEWVLVFLFFVLFCF